MAHGRFVKRAATALVLAAAAGVLVSAQSSQTRPGAVFRATTNYVSTDVKVQNADGQFVPDLRADEFRVYEDGVRQTITTFAPVVGGRVLGSLTTAPAAAPAAEGLILPAARSQPDVSGRIFIVFIDDLHFTRYETPLVRQLLRKIRDTLVRENDLVGFVSSGPSDIQVSPLYDFGHRRFDETIEKVAGRALTPDEIVKDAILETADGPSGLRYNVHAAFSTAYDMLGQLGKIKDRRKSFLYISDGYTLDPYNESRFKQMEKSYESVGLSSIDSTNEEVDDQSNPDDPNASTRVKQSDLSPWDALADPAYLKRTMFAESDLEMELAQLVREARRNNVAFYTIDPRGLDTNFMDASQVTDITTRDMAIYHTQTQGTLRVLADQTGGFCVCDTNDPTPLLQRIDNDTSNYYVIGYVTSNPDPFAIRRTIRIEVTRPGRHQLVYRDSYTIPRPAGR